MNGLRRSLISWSGRACRRTILLLTALAGALAFMHGAQAADALNGRSLYLNGPTGGGATCASCHGPTPANNVNGILAAANNPNVIRNAFAANQGGMGALFNGRFTNAEIDDLAAFIGNPNVTAAPAASVNPASLTFAATTIGQTAGPLATTLANTGNAALNVGTLSLTGAAAGDYTISGGSCANGASIAAGANCTVQVGFRPTAAGARAASLVITHNATGGSSTVALSGTGNAVAQATIALSANAIDFGALASGVASTARTVTVNNTGQAALTFSGITVGGANPGFFTLGGTCGTAAPVPAGGSCTVTVTATGTANGPFSGSLALASNASNGAVSVALSGTVAAAAPAISATPSAVAFGTQSVGAAATTQTVTLANTGNVPLALTSVGVSGAASVTIAANTCGTTLAVGANCVVTLAFAPQAQGAVAANLAVASNAAPLQVAVSGSGTTAPVAVPVLSEQGPVSFADTQVGEGSALHTITLANNGTAALKVASLVLNGAAAADFVLAGSCAANVTVSPGASCGIDIAFRPAAAGQRAATMMLVTDGGAQFSVALAGTGVAVPAAALTANPQAFDFGGTDVNGTPATHRIRVMNGGSNPAVVTAATFAGPFSLQTDSGACAAFPFTLQPGAGCDLIVRFTPAGVGDASGSMALAIDGTAPLSVALSGRGAMPAVPVPATPQNNGGSGCSAATSGNDPVLAVLVVLSVGVLAWRRFAGKTVGANAHANPVRALRPAAGVALALVATIAAPLERGAAAPPFELAGKDGAVQLAQFRGKLVYVDFWASWCGPCRQSFPWMNAMQARYGAQGLQVIGVNLDANAADARGFLAETPAHFPIAFDPAGTTPKAYGIKGMPSSVLVGPDGTVLFEHAGFKAADRANLEKRIQQALGGVK